MNLSSELSTWHLHLYRISMADSSTISTIQVHGSACMIFFCNTATSLGVIGGIKRSSVIQISVSVPVHHLELVKCNSQNHIKIKWPPQSITQRLLSFSMNAKNHTFICIWIFSYKLHICIFLLFRESWFFELFFMRKCGQNALCPSYHPPVIYFEATLINISV